MTGTKKCLANFKDIKGPKVTFGGHGLNGQTKGVGEIQRNDLIIKDVSYVEGLNFNLLSTSQLCDKGYKVEFTKDQCIIKEEFTHQVVLKGSRLKNVYVVDWSTANSNVCLLAKGPSELCWDWHKRLSHLNFKAINKLARRNLVEGLPNLVYVKDKVCDSCQKGKQIKSSFKSKVAESSNRPLSLLHMDLFGPIDPVSVSGRKYTLVVVDDYSRYTWTIFMTKKNETEKELINLLKLLQNQQSQSIVKIRSDRGTEFVNQVIQKYCEEHGILHQLSAARTPQQNGVAERRNRTLKKQHGP